MHLHAWCAAAARQEEKTGMLCNLFNEMVMSVQIIYSIRKECVGLGESKKNLYHVNSKVKETTIKINVNT